MPSPVRVRIAPSPTGEPHVGTAYTALFNLLLAGRMEVREAFAEWADEDSERFGALALRLITTFGDLLFFALCVLKVLRTPQASEHLHSQRDRTPDASAATTDRRVRSRNASSSLQVVENARCLK